MGRTVRTRTTAKSWIRSSPGVLIVATVALAFVAINLSGCAGAQMTQSQQQAADWLGKSIQQRWMSPLSDLRPGVREDWTSYRDSLTSANQGAEHPVMYTDTATPVGPSNMDPSKDPRNGPFYFTATLSGKGAVAFVVWRDNATASWKYATGPGGP